MGLLRDRESELPLLQRLVARLQDAARRPELPAEEWPTAIVAYALHMSEDPSLLSAEDGLSVYADFVQATPPAQRASALGNLAAFVSSRRGSGWRALLLFALGEAASPELCTRAATLAITQAPPVGPGVQPPLVGASAVVQLLLEHAAPPPALLSALLSLPDMRLLPALQPLAELPPARLCPLLAGLTGSLNHLSAACLLQLLEARPSELAESVTAALVRLAAHTPLVADIALPLPTWAFKSPTPQPLQAWSLPEYLPRLLPRLQPHLTPGQLTALREAFV